MGFDMVAITILEGAVIAIVFIVLFSQVVIPLISGTRLFPAFSKRSALKNELIELRDEQEIIELEQEVVRRDGTERNLTVNDYTPLMQRPKTYFIDIDGTIFRQNDSWESGNFGDLNHGALLPGVFRKLNALYTAGHTLILTTARAENFRFATEQQLTRGGIQYHGLLMSLPTGQRVLINDRKPQENIDTAIAINLDRDSGMNDVTL